ncbi:MAG: glycosyltransferase [Deltaproteobacteria bacterium]|jgi:glycosyltransferase involved in cell wall biosynthesis|nr:glycosyltransferase [Deltaproteobacteria bacterium]
MKKLLIYTHDLVCNGSNKHLIRILPHLLKVYEVILVINLEAESEKLIKHLPKQAKNFKILFLENTSFISPLKQLVKIIKQYQPVYVLSLRNEANFVALLSKRLIIGLTKSGLATCPKYVCLVQQHFSKQFKYARTVKERLFLKTLLRLYKSADLIVSASEGLAIDLNNLIPRLINKIKPVYNAGFDGDYAKLEVASVGDRWFNEKSKQLVGNSKRSKKINSGKKFVLPEFNFQPAAPVPIIISCCNLKEHKNLELLIQAFSIVVKKQPARLVLLGIPAIPLLTSVVEQKDLSAAKISKLELEYIVKLSGLISQLKLEQSVKVLPFQNNPYKFFSKSDIFVLPSLYEGFATVLVEAMSAKCPVIACNCQSSPNEIIEDNKSGFLIAVNNVNELAQNILLLLTRPELQQKFREEGFLRSQKFSAENSVAGLIKLLDKL